MQSQRFTASNPPFYHAGQPNKDPSSVIVLEKLEKVDFEELYPICNVEDIIRPTSRVLTVAISGCTSSGKTTLALLLSEIFSSFSNTNEVADSNSQNGLKKDPLDDTEVVAPFTTPFTTTIHQDAFFIPKRNCPFVEFNSTNNDKDFMERSVSQKDEVSVYSYSSAGTKGKGIVRIAGPNTDCMEAVDFGNLLRRVQAAQREKVETEKHTQFKEDADRKILVEQYFGLIASMRRKVKEHLALTTLSNGSGNEINEAENITGWVFVEGFLLFSRTTPSEGRSLISNNCSKDEKRYAAVSEDLQPKTKEEFTQMEKGMTRTNEEKIQSKEALMQEFDIKLFLPTSKEVSKNRRMTRFPYVDFPAGGRHPGQMWKSEGYFEEVVWKGYEDSFSWLLKDTDKRNVNGVFVRTTVDDTVENTVDWAVDVILEFLKTNGKNQEGIIEQLSS